MEGFRLVRKADRDELTVNYKGSALLRMPLCNKGTGFTQEERRRLGIEGLLPAQHNSIETQAERIYKSIFFNPDPVGRHIELSLLQNRNEVLFYKLLSLHLEEAMPIVYTPTVGKASQYYSRVYRRARGIFITPQHKGRMEAVLRNGAEYRDVRLMVVTDNEAILGIGDQGAGGMAISVGKLALYCVGAGIHPASTLPISLDVGTNNKDLLDDPLYLGWREERLTGSEYLEILDEFVSAARTVFPDVMIQWEDFRKENALNVLGRFADVLPSFNDDIQGTGAVAAACVHAACRASNRDMRDSRIVIYGAGAAGLGVARQLRHSLRLAGLSEDASAGRILALDSRGIISDARPGLDAFKQELARPEEQVAALGLDEENRADLASIVRAFGADVLIGTSGQAGSFDEIVVRAMADNCERPVILPMSNPTAISEGTPEDILRWSDGRALVATGSPFDPVRLGGVTRPVGQANNVFVFPGIGLGTIVSGATRVTDTMIAAASEALAAALSEADLGEGRLVPRISRLWDVCGDVGLAVAKQAINDGVAAPMSDSQLAEALEAYRWIPRYPEIIVRES